MQSHTFRKIGMMVQPILSKKHLKQFTLSVKKMFIEGLCEKNSNDIANGPIIPDHSVV